MQTSMTTGRVRRLLARVSAAAIACGAIAGAPAAAHAFCGFYVSGADAKLFNNASQVVLMRKGTRTVLSMQNNYQGPPENFAMIVPVPVVLQEDNVVTLPKEVFDRVDQLSAPRLVEYWEQDPCMKDIYPGAVAKSGAVPSAMPVETASAGDLGVTIEAQFEVGEYQIVILSAKDSTGLDTWLRQEKYSIPEGAEPLLKPYVEDGSKFFVAKVDVQKVKFENGMAQLSPLRFHYDSDSFALPVRLGLINAQAKQDLIVHILSPGSRFELANMKNVFIPTNLDLQEGMKERFGEFYAALFDSTLEKNPGAAVTEYSWDASTCDPCPQPPLEPGELMTLGADVLDKPANAPAEAPAAQDQEEAPARVAMPPPPPPTHGFVHTRLHLRYDKSSLGDDLVFKVGEPMVGGREQRSGPNGELEQGAVRDSYNNFQARYAIRHPWTGPIECQDPVRGRWGGPPGGGEPQPRPATDLAFAPRGKLTLANAVAQPVPELGVQPEGLPAKPANKDDKAQGKSETKAKKKGCGSCAAGGGAEGGAVWMLGLGLAIAFSRRRRRR